MIIINLMFIKLDNIVFRLYYMVNEFEGDRK